MTRRCHFLPACFAALLMAGCHTAEKAAGAIILPLADGGMEQVLKPASTRLVVLLFVATECPVSNHLAPEYNRLADAYSQKGVTFRLVYSGDEAVPVLVAKHRSDYGLRVPALLDRKFALAGLTGARWTPEAAICTGNGAMLYHGRVSNLIEALGKMRPEPTVHDLRRALDELLAGKPVSQPFVKPVGCYLPLPATSKATP